MGLEPREKTRILGLYICLNAQVWAFPSFSSGWSSWEFQCSISQHPDTPGDGPFPFSRSSFQTQIIPLSRRVQPSPGWGGSSACPGPGCERWRSISTSSRGKASDQASSSRPTSSARLPRSLRSAAWIQPLHASHHKCPLVALFFFFLFLFSLAIFSHLGAQQQGWQTLCYPITQPRFGTSSAKTLPSHWAKWLVMLLIKASCHTQEIYFLCHIFSSKRHSESSEDHVRLNQLPNRLVLFLVPLDFDRSLFSVPRKEARPVLCPRRSHHQPCTLSTAVSPVHQPRHPCVLITPRPR